jgi:radical SAM-linked protein
MALNNIIQQGFRRSGIIVSHSQGFHPKMLISHPPALPLGMEGLTEWIEFKSSYDFSEKQFVSRINPYLIEGLQFFGLRQLDKAEPPMNRKTRAFVYSIDLGNRKIKQAVENFCSHYDPSENYWDKVLKCVNDYNEKNGGESLEGISVDKKQKKLFLIIKNIPQKGKKPQDIVASIFGLDNPVFSMAREQFLCDGQEKP